MSFSKLHKDLLRLRMRQVDLLISRAMRPLVCRCSSHIREALDDCLQQQRECYLHPGWKGPCFLHQHNRFRIEARGLYKRKDHQVSEILISSSLIVMILTWAHKVKTLERSLRSNKKTLMPCPPTWIEPNGIYNIWSRGTSSLRISRWLWSYKTFVKTAKLPEGGGWSSLPWSKRSMPIGSHGSKESISTWSGS